MLVLLGDNPECINSEAAFAKICSVCPIPASSGKTNRHRTNRGGNRKANAAVATVRVKAHPPTLNNLKKEPQMVNQRVKSIVF
uniref:Transposase IS116/IS110/IS902 C-terminal domain-containing protein n=1 Tax=OCS116 cluster bacterium TaxID=2030921 RepID=A0A2A4Z5Z6_9PROT